MASLRSFTEGFNSYSEFYSRSVSSSDSSVVSASNTSLALAGTHKITVGENIRARVASRSVDPTADVSGGGGNVVVTVGSATAVTATIAGGDTVSQIAAKIEAADDAQDDVLDVQVINDKDRGGTVYQRLVITAKNGGSDNAITVSDPTDLNLDQTSVDAVYDDSNWLGTSSATSGGTYSGSVNKTFTFRVNNTGSIGVDDITIQWADTDGNNGSFVVTAGATDYEVFQGVTVQFSAGAAFKDDSFTIDAYHPTLQAAQDKGVAQVEQLVHEGFSDLITSVNSAAATFVYSYEGREITVNLDADSNLGDLVDKINSDPNNPGVTASIINDGQSTAKSYHLVLTGQDTGAAHSIKIISESLDNFDGAEGKYTVAQAATNAMLKLDGFPSDSAEYIQRSSNRVNNLISGITLQVQDAGTANITVNSDVDAIRSNIELLVSSVNFVQDYIRQETKYDADTGTAGLMQGNYTFNIVYDVINEFLTDSVPGLSSDQDTYVHLSQIGITTDPSQNGLWVIDDQLLSDALNNNLEAVARLFVNDTDYGSTGVVERLRDKMQDLTDSETGIANVLLDNYQGIISDIEQKIEREEKRIETVRERLETKFANLEKLLSELDGQSNSLENLINQLPSIGNK